MGTPKWHWTLQPNADEIRVRIAHSRRGKPGRPRIDFDENEAERLYREGAGTTALEKRFGVSHTIINRRLQERGVILRGYATSRRERHAHHDKLWNVSWVRRQYRTKSITTIAADLGVSDQTVYRALKRYTIPSRRDEHASRANKFSPRAAAQRREKLGRWPSQLQKILGMTLYRLGFTDIRHEEPFDRFSVDWYSPSLHLAFEADGSFHELPGHREHDQQRDAFLVTQFDLPVVRLTTTDVRRLARAV